MARRRLEGLARVLGVNALLSTAYGDVGAGRAGRRIIESRPAPRPQRAARRGRATVAA